TWIVIIDPGHGGRDPGVVTRRARLKEKDVVLDVALRLKRVLDPEAGVEVRLTRDQDMFLGLRDRVVRSEALGGDLFLSIHVNGCRQQAARGAEVFFLSLRGATSAAARELEALENSVDATQDPMLGEMAELPFAVDLLQTDTILRSSFLAETILDALDQSGLAATRGVKQANFAVLRSCRLPSALIELGFMSNPEDARKLGSASHRQALAETIAIGLLEFQRRYARHTEAPSERTSKASP
ncbi:MAG: N-acetylmuramoyl-L-alanine amidase, partial [Candidatus Eisenbacteria sp.]|nr:N-acetylmuramoyl-L-alanine amidase [Candidatus Eisenbacteria bacterium]